MGLDMYLEKHIYIGAYYNHRNITGTVEIFQDKKPININFDKISTIVEQAGYWRKANAIHKWFVDNVQEGKDDCGEYYVPTSKILELYFTAKKVKENPKIAPELLPTQDGFFFGSTNYGQDYFEDIDLTLEILAPIVQEIQLGTSTGEYYYQSSW